MSKVVEFQFDKKDVLLQVKLRTYYHGEALKDDKMIELATKMQANDDNDDVLAGFATNAGNKLIDVLNPVCIDAEMEKNAVEGSEVFKFTLTMTDTYADSQTNIIKDGSFDYMVNWAVYEWFTLMFPSSSKNFFDKCTLIENDIRRRINKRLKPIPHENNV